MSVLAAAVAGFASGIGLRSIFYFGWPIIAFALLLALLFAGAAFFTARPAYTLGAVLCIALAFGIARASLADTPLPLAFKSDLRHRVAYDGIVTGDPDVREKSQRIPLVVYKDDSAAGALAVMPLSSRVAVGDRIRVYGTLFVPQAFETGGGRTFRYDKYLQARGIRFLIQFGTISARGSAPWYSPSALLARVKHAFIDGLARALPRPDSALASGIVIGGKEGLGQELTGAFQRSGLTQIIVLSGYNVMIVAEWVMVCLAFFALPRRLQFFAGGAALLLFVGIAGLSSTAVRAAMMALIALYARATGRSYAANRALLLAVLLMLLYNPLYLAFDPGFGLSVAATAGIIWLSPRIEARFSHLHPFVRTALATTLAAQLAVLPLLLYDIGLLSLVAIPANLLVNAVMPLAMALSALAGVVGMTLGQASGAAAHLFGIPAHLLTRYIIFIAQKGASLPYGAVTVPAFPFAFVLLAYATLFIASSKRFSSTLPFKFFQKAST